MDVPNRRPSARLRAAGTRADTLQDRYIEARGPNVAYDPVRADRRGDVLRLRSLWSAAEDPWMAASRRVRLCNHLYGPIDLSGVESAPWSLPPLPLRVPVAARL